MGELNRFMGLARPHSRLCGSLAQAYAPHMCYGPRLKTSLELMWLTSPTLATQTRDRTRHANDKNPGFGPIFKGILPKIANFTGNSPGNGLFAKNTVNSRYLRFSRRVGDSVKAFTTTLGCHSLTKYMS